MVKILKGPPHTHIVQSINTKLHTGEDNISMHLTDEDQPEDMDHEPIRSNSASDIRRVQPMATEQDLPTQSLAYQHAFINNVNNNTGNTHGQPFQPPSPAEWYAQYAAASAAALSLSAAGIHPLLHIMGNSASHHHHGHPSNNNITIDGEVYEVSQAKMLFTKIKEELARSQRETERFKSELLSAQQKLLDKDRRIDNLQREVDQLQCVLQQKVDGGKTDILSTIQEDISMSSAEGQTRKKQGVSGESSTSSNAQVELKHYRKDAQTKQLIKNAIKQNDFLKKIDKNQVAEIVNCMQEEVYKAGELIVKQHEGGNHFYVSAEGDLEVLKDGKPVGSMSPGRAFGELAVLYGCARTASIRALQAAKVWALERKVFQAIMVRTGMERLNARIEFLKSVPSLCKLSKDEIAKVADVLEVDFFEEGEYIVREGQVGDTFYIIADGSVAITQKLVGHDEPQQIRTLTKGSFFGEKALLTEERRTASVMALGPGVELLALNRDAFVKHIGNLQVFEQDYGDQQRQAEWKDSANSESSESDSILGAKYSLETQFKDLSLSDLDVLGTLGIGGFGRVELVQMRKDRNKTFALKCLKKRHIVDTRQQEHVYSEKKILLYCSSPFIVRLHKTFRDRKFVYMLMEVCLGGELWTILRDRAHFDDSTARFCVACVLKAFQYLHSKGIVYRDLKPENLLVTEQGYIKLVDFGFAKHIPRGRKTWTFCGTPEYVAPEIILNKGHDHAVDIWALGILVYELATGIPPFTASDPMRTYNIILRGIDALEFPKKVSRNAQSLIKKVCRENPSDRLGYQKNGLFDIMKHKWFQGFDWDGLTDMTLQPPFRRIISSSSDKSNFDHYPSEIEQPPDEMSGWDEDF